MSEQTHLKLRRTVAPYIGQSTIMIGVSVFSALVAWKKDQWDIFWWSLVTWLPFAAYVYFFGLRYNIWWDDVGVTMSASGGPRRHVRFDEISEIRYEVASGGEFLSQARPFRRIVLIGPRLGAKAPIDISLRHFRFEDIRNLLTEIHELRPDLSLPAIPKISKKSPRM